MKFYKGEITKFEFHIPLIERELAEGRDPTATLGTFGFTFLDDIERLFSYLKETGRDELLAKLKDGE
jgi:hypothetical protein